MLLALFAFLVGAGMVFGAYYAYSEVPAMMAQRRLEKRLGEMAKAPDESSDPAGVLRLQASGPLPALAKFVSGTERGSRLSAWVQQSGARIAPSSLILIGTGLGGAFALFATMLFRSPFAMPLGFAFGFAVPFVVLKIKRR